MDKKQAQTLGEITTGLARDLTLFDLIMMGVGMMVGAGAVLGMGVSVRLAGPGGTLIAFALSGLLTFLTAMAYAEMSSAIPRAGSIYNFARIAFGRPVGFLAGWISWLASAVAGSLYASLCGMYAVDYLSHLGLLGWLPLPVVVEERLCAVLFALLFLGVNYRGVSETGKAQTFLTLAQTLALLFIAAVGIIVGIRDPARLANFTPFLPRGWSAVLVCMAFEFVAFEGYEVIATAGDEAINPRRNLPRAILWSVAIVTLTYIAVAFALIVGIADVGMPPWEWLALQGEKGFGEAVARLIPFGGLLATLTVLFAGTSALNATIYSATRVSYALGRDRMLPGVLGRISATRKTPWVALLFTALIVTLVAAFLPIIHVAATASILFLFMFVLADLCVIKLRRNMAGELTYGFLMPLFPFLPAIAVVVQFVLALYIFNVSPIAWVMATTWILAGIALYLAYARSHVLPIREEILTVEETPALAPEGPRILVPVDSPENALRMIASVVRLADAEQASVELIHMVTIPDQVPLSDAPLYAARGKEAIAEAMLYLAARFPVRTSIRYCRNAARGILAQARRQKVDMILLGSESGPHERKRVLGSTITQVLGRAPCNVLVFRNCAKPPYKRVLVPLTRNPSDALALKTASVLIDRYRGTLVALQIVPPGATSPDLDALLKEADPERNHPPARVELRRVLPKNAPQAILKEASSCDLIVMAAAEHRWSRPAKTLTLTETLAFTSDKPLVIVKIKARSQPLLGRWL